MANGVDTAVNWSKHIGDIYRYFRVGYAGHSNTNAYLLVALSHLIYSGNSFGNGTFVEKFRFSAQNLSASDPFKVDIYDSGNADKYDTQAAVLSNSKVTIVVFRGSETITDWINDFTFQLQAAPGSWGRGVRVHKGFANALHTVYLQIKQAVANSNKPVYVTGHSLGGALATLCAYRLQKVDGIHVSGVYTFGAPRVGNSEFKEEYNKILLEETFRWVNKYDTTPQVPNYGPGVVALPTTYYHVGQLNYIPPYGVVMMNANDFEPSQSSGGDHSMDHYFNKMLERLSDNQRTQVNSPYDLVIGDVPDLL